MSNAGSAKRAAFTVPELCAGHFRACSGTGGGTRARPSSGGSPVLQLPQNRRPRGSRRHLPGPCAEAGAADRRRASSRARRRAAVGAAERRNAAGRRPGPGSFANGSGRSANYYQCRDGACAGRCCCAHECNRSGFCAGRPAEQRQQLVPGACTGPVLRCGSPQPGHKHM